MFSADAKMNIIIKSFDNVLHLASYISNKIIVSQMLERTKNVNTFDKYFKSLLIATLKENHLNIVKMLLRWDIDINYYASEHGFVLHYACTQQYKRIIQSLLDHNANINSCNSKHESALTTAASQSLNQYFSQDTKSYKKQRTIVELLLRCELKI